MQLLTSSSDFSNSLAIVSSGSYIIAIVPIAASADSDFWSAEHTSFLNIRFYNLNPNFAYRWFFKKIEFASNVV